MFQLSLFDNIATFVHKTIVCIAKRYVLWWRIWRQTPFVVFLKRYSIGYFPDSLTMVILLCQRGSGWAFPYHILLTDRFFLRSPSVSWSMFVRRIVPHYSMCTMMIHSLFHPRNFPIEVLHFKWNYLLSLFWVNFVFHLEFTISIGKCFSPTNYTLMAFFWFPRLSFRNRDSIQRGRPD